MIERIKKTLGKFRQPRDLTEGTISRHIFYLALPVIFSNLFQTLFNIVDMFWVGRLGASALAAVAMSGSIMMVLMFVLMGVGMGTIALVSRYTGAKQEHAADNAAMQSLLLGTVLALILSIIGYYLTVPLLKLLGADPEVLLLGKDYLQVIFLGVIVVFYMFLVSAIFQGAGDTLTPMFILGTVTFVNIILDPLMIFGVGPFPEMGVTGAAWATVISEGLGSLIALSLIFLGFSRVHVRLSEFRVDFPTIMKILEIGVPASAQMSLRGFMMVFLMAFVAGFGTMAVAAYGVGLRLNMIVMMPGFGFAAAAATLVGQNLGAKAPKRASQSAWTATWYYMIFMFIMALLFFIFAPQLISIFNRVPEVISIGAIFLRLVSLSFIFTALGLVLGRAMNGAGDTISPLVLTFISLWMVQIPLAYYLSNFTPLGVRGVFYSILISNTLLGVLSAFWFNLGLWKKKRL